MDQAASFKAKLDAYARETNKAVQGTFSVEAGLTFSDIIPFPPHEEADRYLASSAVTKFTIRNENGRPQDHVASGTSTLLHVKARALYLYASGGSNDLDWTRKASSAWVGAILAANPSDLSSRMKEQSPYVMTFVGALMAGALFSLVVSVFRRRPEGQQ